MSLASFAADCEDLKARIANWAKRDLAAARHAGHALLTERDILIEQATAHGASKRHAMRDLPRPDIGAALALDIHETPPVGQTDAKPGEDAGGSAGELAAE